MKLSYLNDQFINNLSIDQLEKYINLFDDNGFIEFCKKYLGLTDEGLKALKDNIILYIEEMKNETS